MKVRIDRSLPATPRAQLRAALEQAIGFGDLPPGAPLPSVRELAAAAGVAPMTVSKVFAELKARGLIETRAGAGTFVAAEGARRPSPDALAGLRREMDGVVDRALALGLPAEEVAALFAARAADRAARGKLRSVVMVGLFPEATRSYARSVAEQVGDHARVDPVTIEEVSGNPEIRRAVAAADIALTFANLDKELARLVPEARIVTTRFIPSEATRLALASLNPLAKVAAVSRFPDFLPVLTLGVRRFAAHAPDVEALNLDDPDLARKLADRDVVVMSTGADAAAGIAPPDALKIEYRHIPDPGDIERLVIPAVTSPAGSDAHDRKEAS